MDALIVASRLTDQQKNILRAHYIPTWQSARRWHIFFGIIYWGCTAISTLGSIAITTYLASSANKTAGETTNYVMATLASVVGSMMVIVKALKINEFYFNDITGDLEALIWILLGSELPDWATFTAQFDSLQKREKSKLQAVATEIQNEARDRASKSITREISGDVEESATPPRKSKGSVRAQSSEESE